MTKKVTIGFVTVLLLMLIANTAAAHNDPETNNSILHGVQHLLMSRDFVLGVFGAGLVVAIAGIRSIRMRRFR